MASPISVEVRYDISNMEYGGRLEVSKFTVRKSGIGSATNRMSVEFEGKGYLNRAFVYLEPEIAIPLARNLLSVAEGYLTKTESVIA